MEKGCSIFPSRASRILGANDLQEFSGIRVIPDVHGHLVSFAERIEEAEAAGLFVIQLGDLIDRGADSPLCVESMLDVESRGRGAMVLGNHEFAFLRFLFSTFRGRPRHIRYRSVAHIPICMPADIEQRDA